MVILGVILAAWVLLKLFKVSFKIIWKLLVNALIGGLAVSYTHLTLPTN